MIVYPGIFKFRAPLLIGIVAGMLCAAETSDVLVLTEMEQLKLSNLQWRRRAIEAEYRQQMTQLAYDEMTYVSQVGAAHPGAMESNTFDQQSVSWIRRVGPVGASGGAK